MFRGQVFYVKILLTSFQELNQQSYVEDNNLLQSRQEDATILCVFLADVSLTCINACT